MESRLLSPTNDYVFKNIFGTDIEILADLIRAILDLTEHEILRMEIVDPGLQADAVNEKFIILDIRVTIGKDKIIDVEIQVWKHLGFLNRGQFYLARMLTRSLKRGEGFAALPKTISIWITSFTIFETDDRYHHRFVMYDSEHSLEYPNGLEMHFLELPKVAGDTSNPNCRNWLNFLRSSTEEEFMQAAEKSPLIARALETLRKISGNETMRMEADARERFLNDMVDSYNTGYKTGFDSGFDDGKKEGDANASRRMALNMLADGVPIEKILRYTGMTSEQLAALQAS